MSDVITLLEDGYSKILSSVSLLYYGTLRTWISTEFESYIGMVDEWLIGKEPACQYRKT